MVKVVSHVRSGTHLLCKLLHQNLPTGASDYEELHCSHSRVPDEPFVHVCRDLLSVAVSLWRMRERFGFGASVSFHDLVTVSLEALPRSVSCEVYRNGELVREVGAMRDATGLLPDRWSWYVKMFAARASLNFRYDQVVRHPRTVVGAVAKLYGLEELPFTPVVGRVGWWSAVDEQPIVSYEDYRMLERVSARTFQEAGL